MTLHDHDNRRRGADYQTFENRLPTVKLTTPERTNLWSLALKLIDDPTNDIDYQLLRDVVAKALGPDRADEYLARLRGVELPNFRDISRRENVLLLASIYPHIPGDDEEAKMDWVVREVRPAFTPERWDNEIVPYLLERIAEYRAAGGTLDRYPEVIEPDPADDADHVVRVIVQWFGGVDMSGASVDEDYDLVVSADGAIWSRPPSSWPVGNAGPGGGEDAVATCCAAYQREDGSWVGGKYDWLTADLRRRSFENIRDGYPGGTNAWVAPRSGTKVLLWAHTASGHRVSKMAEVIWP